MTPATRSPYLSSVGVKGTMVKFAAFLRTAAVIPLLVALQAQTAAPVRVTVFKTPTCGCCGKWAEHLKANGFAPTIRDVPSTAAYQQRYGVPGQLRSCHTPRSQNSSSM